MSRALAFTSFRLDHHLRFWFCHPSVVALCRESCPAVKCSGSVPSYRLLITFWEHLWFLQRLASCPFLTGIPLFYLRDASIARFASFRSYAWYCVEPQRTRICKSEPSQQKMSQTSTEREHFSEDSAGTVLACLQPQPSLTRKANDALYPRR